MFFVGFPSWGVGSKTEKTPRDPAGVLTWFCASSSFLAQVPMAIDRHSPQVLRRRLVACTARPRCSKRITLLLGRVSPRVVLADATSQPSFPLEVRSMKNLRGPHTNLDSCLFLFHPNGPRLLVTNYLYVNVLFGFFTHDPSFPRDTHSSPLRLAIRVCLSRASLRLNSQLRRP